jgi:predicted nuclease of restriction endonuclease-like (RecB) superfamily
MLSWSHYVVLLTIKDPSERSFYEIESASSGWSQPELKRQVASCLYERLALSRDKKRVRGLAEEGHTITQPADILKSPLARMPSMAATTVIFNNVVWRLLIWPGRRPTV